MVLPSETLEEQWVLEDERWSQVTAEANRSISELVADEEHCATPEETSTKKHNMIDAEINRNRRVRDELLVSINRLRSYPLDDVFPDGTVLIWHSDDEESWDQHFAAVRDNNRWYVTGEYHGYPWDELVVTRMKGWYWSEVEVVRPTEKK